MRPGQDHQPTQLVLVQVANGIEEIPVKCHG
jgi:hypothetical protein